jgi:hypothetical protein
MGQLEHAFECGKRGERLTRCAFMLAAVADAKSSACSGLRWSGQLRRCIKPSGFGQF